MNDAGTRSRLRVNDPFERGRLATISSATPRRPITLVLGMHRSGTSLCSHLLSILGVDMTDQVAGPGHAGPASDNPRGHWERWEIVQFHDRILQVFNRGYYTPFHDFSLPVAWWADPRVAQIRREIVSFLDQRMGDTPFGFKDPRTVRLMPVWHQIISEMKLAPKIVLCLRNPAQVARSLGARDSLGADAGEYRWLTYMMDFFRYAGNLDFCTIEYEAWFDDPRVNLAKLTKFLDLEWQPNEAELDLVLADIVDPGLRHDGSSRVEASQPLARSIYKLAARAGEDAAAREQIGYMASQFVGFQQLQRPFYRRFEEIVEAADGKGTAAEARLAEALAQLETQGARLAEVEGERNDYAGTLQRFAEETSHLRGVVAEREAALEATNIEVAATNMRLAETLVETEARRVRLAEVEAERDDHAGALRRFTDETIRLRGIIAEREATLEATGAEMAPAKMRLAGTPVELEAQRARLAEIEAERDDHAEALQRFAEETTRLRSVVAEGEVRLEAANGKLAAAETRLAEALGEIETQKTRLAEIEGERDEQAEAVEIVRSQVSALQAALIERENIAAGLEARLAEREAALQAAGTRTEEVEAQFATAVTEIGVLRVEVARSSAAIHAHVGAGEAMQAQITSLHGDIAAARQVGKAMLASLRSVAAPPPPEREGGLTGWRAVLLKFFGLGTGTV